jgi:hypothetical protein
MDLATSTQIRSCLNCAYKKGRLCVKTGYGWELQRKYPDSGCDNNYSGWVLNPALTKKKTAGGLVIGPQTKLEPYIKYLLIIQAVVFIIFCLVKLVF